MRTSVIIVTYNSRGYLGGCIESIGEDLGTHDEIIVVDNGSTDGSAEFIRDLYPEITLICGPNDGYAGGNNRGAAVAKGDYLLFLNPDTVIHRGTIDALITPLMCHNDVGLTTACVVLMNRPDIVNTCGHVMHYTGLTYCRGAGQSRTNFTAEVDVDGVSGAAFAVRRTVFEELHGFDEKFFMYVEDTDLSWRARSAGYRCLYLPTAIVEHDYTMRYSPAKAFYLDRNRHMMLFKNLNQQTYLLMTPGLLIGEIVTWGFLILNGPRYWGVKLKVYRWLYEQRGMLRASRNTTQSPRLQGDRDIVARLTYRLEFEQLANKFLARLAGAIFHPAFWVARLFFARAWT